MSADAIERNPLRLMIVAGEASGDAHAATCADATFAAVTVSKCSSGT